MTSPEETEINQLLNSARSIALVGASNKPERPSFHVMEYLLASGYKVTPVNPGLAGQTLLGQTVYATLADIPHQIDLVDVFRESSAAPAIVDEAIAIKAKAVWLQLGVKSPEAEAKARAAGLGFVQNRCTKIEHIRLQGAARLT
jgi:predicted CoA-binding protein